MRTPRQGHHIDDLNTLGRVGTAARHSPTAQSPVIFERFVDRAVVDDGETTAKQNKYDLPDLLSGGMDHQRPHLGTANAWGCLGSSGGRHFLFSDEDGSSEHYSRSGI